MPDRNNLKHGDTIKIVVNGRSGVLSQKQYGVFEIEGEICYHSVSNHKVSKVAKSNNVIKL